MGGGRRVRRRVVLICFGRKPARVNERAAVVVVCARAVVVVVFGAAWVPGLGCARGVRAVGGVGA